MCKCLNNALRNVLAFSYFGSLVLFRFICYNIKISLFPLGDEMLSDIYKIKVINDMFYEVEGKVHFKQHIHFM